ncbi:MAG: ORF6N domain-containing protein [Phycisphaerales bacterium]
MARYEEPNIKSEDKPHADPPSVVVTQRVQNLILVVRDQKVILDSDLAALYGVTTKRLNEQVRRNSDRFPADFMFQLSAEETEHLRSQSATSNASAGRGGRRYCPYVFTEHGALMAASVLKSDRAIQTSIFVVRAFIRLKQTLASHEALAAKVKRLQKTVRDHDKQIVAIVDAIQLLTPPQDEPPKEPFGFRRARKN